MLPVSHSLSLAQNPYGPVLPPGPVPMAGPPPGPYPYPPPPAGHVPYLQPPPPPPHVPAHQVIPVLLISADT